jgi:N-acylglucosamine-6-phosphate 2-epimerase
VTLTRHPGANAEPEAVLTALQGGLVVSCQSPEGSPLRRPAITALLAEAALLGGAVGLRLEGPADIAAVRAKVDVPIIGLYKVMGPRRNIITPSLEHARALVEAGADIIAIDATAEVRGRDFGILTAVATELGVPVMADVSTLEEGLLAVEHGVAIVGTTLSGYTPDSLQRSEPDIDLVAALAARGVTVFAEGRYRTPEHVAEAFAAGARAVVVGGAITDPLSTTQRFVGATPVGRRA